VIIATGARYRRLDVPGIERFEGVSAFSAATPIEAQLCGGRTVAVVGGGNSAGQAALYLSRTATVYLLVRADRLEESMSRYLAARLRAHPAVEVLLNHEVRELRGEAVLEEVVVEETRSRQRRNIAARALFVFIGAEPHVGWLAGHCALDSHGFVLTGDDAVSAGASEAAAVASGDSRRSSLETSRPGVFAVGDVRHGSVKRVASAVGEGAMAVRLVHEHLSLLS
jgi:thioredoxin reductase (NADPH)